MKNQNGSFNVSFFGVFKSNPARVATVFGLSLAPLFLVAANSAHARPLALVYKGPGSCVDDGHCSEAAANVAERAGFDVEFVGPRTKDVSLFEEAAVYIQPGGNATEVADAMLASMKRQIKNFVFNGGGYVGYCAGGFYAMTPYDEEGQNRLGLLEGDADGADFDYPSIVAVSWLDGIRKYMFWEGGAYFIAPRNKSKNKNTAFEVVSRYSATRQAAAIRGQYGEGRVFVSGYHPEAPYDWRFDPKLDDPDGTDADLELAADMIRWVANPPRRR